MLNTNVMDALGNTSRQSYASLRLSLDISIQNIKHKEPESLKFFKFMGLLPGGVEASELNKLWGDNSWAVSAERLRTASLLVSRPLEKQFTLLPFMITRALELLDEDEGSLALEFHLKCCKFYKEFCERSLELINENNFTLGELIKKEANIWACIYRSVNRK